MSEFTLRIELGNAAMQDSLAVSEALLDVSRRIDQGGHRGPNGNSVNRAGALECFAEPLDDTPVLEECDALLRE